MEQAHFVASSKGINLLKTFLITTCISTSKTRHTKHRPPTGARNTETDAKCIAVLIKESNEQVLVATYLESNLFMARTNWFGKQQVFDSN